MRRTGNGTNISRHRMWMGILTRYLIRSHVGPFLFALSALTGLLFVNAVAQRLDDLVGKGLTAEIILEFLYLSIPHTLALTLPMAVLVAVLYAFSSLTSANELTAMSAGGIRPARLLIMVAIPDARKAEPVVKAPPIPELGPAKVLVRADAHGRSSMFV